MAPVHTLHHTLPCAIRSRMMWLRLSLVLILVSLPVAFALGAVEVDVRVEGVSKPLAENVKMHIAQLSLPDMQEARRQRALIQRKARNGMEAMGYYDAGIQLQFPPKEQTGDVVVIIVSGDPVFWRNTDVVMSGSGASDSLFKAVLRQKTPIPGTVLVHQDYETLKRQLRVVALSNGYFDAKFQRQQLRIDREQHWADIDLEFSTGIRYRFGDISFTPTRLSKKALRRLVPFKAGEYYQESQLTELNRNLLDTGYFKTVNLQPQQVTATDEKSAVVPVEVGLADAEDNRISVGLGYGTDTGPRVRMTWLKPLINSYGHSLQLSTSLSEPRQEVTTEYKIPAGNPGTDFWLLQAGYLEEKFENNQYRQISYGVSRQQQVWGEWNRTIFTKFKQEEGFIEGDLVEESRPSDSFYITPGISFSRVKSEGGIRPVRGNRLEADLEFSDPSIGSDTQYVRVSALAKYLESLSERQQILLRLQLGMLWSDDFNQVPVSARFFAGGDQSIRGYSYNSVAPEDAGGALIGGSRLAVASVEYLYRILPNWQTALFVDHGGAIDESSEPIETGAGIGLRWLSPVGVISIDVAKAVTTDGDYRLHITMGTVL